MCDGPVFRVVTLPYGRVMDYRVVSPFDLYIDLRRAVLFCDTAGSADFS